METSIDDRFSPGDWATGLSLEGLPPFPDLEFAAALGEETGEQTGPSGSAPTENAQGEDDDRDDDNPDGKDGKADATDANDRKADTRLSADTEASSPGPETTTDPGEASGRDDIIGTADTNGTADANKKDDEARPASCVPDPPERHRREYLPERAYELLPELLSGPADRIGDRRERDVFLTGALPVWAGALSGMRFRYGGSAVSPNLYSATIAPPASGKSALHHARAYGKPLSEELRAGGPGAKTEEGDAEGGNAEGSEGLSSRAPSDPAPTGRRLFLAADSSAAALKERLAESPHGVICETEFRTVSQALGSSWGSFSDVLLKGFQNETIKMSRSSAGTLTISHPAPSIALAGTPATFDGFISGTADGLFSRFLLYRFDRAFEWRPQFEEHGTGLGESLQEAAEEFQVGYHQLRAREEPLWITVPERLQKVHDRTFRSLTQQWRAEENVPRALQASLIRAGLQAVKIAVVLCGIRLVESRALAAGPDEVPLRPADMEAGLRLALTYLLHGIRVEAGLREETVPRAELTERKRNYLEALPDGRFSTADAKALASRVGASKRGVQRWLKTWREAGLLAKPERGTWVKLGPKLGGIAGAQNVSSVINEIPTLTASPHRSQ